MEPKERGSAARASASIEDEQKQNLTQSGDFDQSDTSIKLDCEETLTSVRQENNTNALNLIEELNLCNTTSAVIHRMKGLISFKIATLVNDLNEKEIHLKDAIESARKVVSLLPNCIDYVHFYTNQLYFASNDCKGYEEVVQECRRALSIQNSIPETGVAHNMKQNLHLIIQRSNIALISIWMKKLRTKTVGEKVGLVTMKQILKDSIEVEHKNEISVPTKKISEVELRNKSKKSNKTEEECRKEIEVRVTAARILPIPSNA